jgi:hypothetical protein
MAEQFGWEFLAVLGNPIIKTSDLFGLKAWMAPYGSFATAKKRK